MSLTEKITVVETAPVKSEKPIVLVGLPDVGLVGIISVMHLINTLEMQEVGYIESDLMPPIIIVHDNKIFEPIRIYAKDNLLLLTSEVPIPSALVKPLTRSIIEWAKQKKPKLIVTLGGIPTPNRDNIEKPECYSLETDDEAKKYVENLKVEKLTEGIMVGPYPMILREAQKNGIPAVALLAQAFDKYPDPGAAASIIEVLEKLLNINVNVDELLKSAEEIRVRTRDLMRRTDMTMQQMGKTQELELPAMYT